MRVLLVSHRFPPDDVGGVERYTQDLAAELVRTGDTVAIATRRSEPGRKDLRMLRERLPDGSSLYRFVAGSVSFEHYLDEHFRLERFFKMAVIESGPDVVHINHLMGLSPRAISIAHRLGAAVVVSLHDFYFVCPRVHLQKPGGDLCDGPNDGHECVKACFTGASANREQWGMRSRYFRRALTMAERIVCYSEFVGSYFRDIVGDRVPLQIIPNGVLSEPAPYAISTSAAGRSGTLNLGYFGTVAPHKGTHLLLEALRIASLPSVSLLVVGHYPNAAYVRGLRQTAASLPGLTMRIYGTYERRELPFLIKGVDCVVVPSIVPEAGPIVPREALAEGVPVIAARIGALTELIREGENGFTFDPNRPDELAAILKRLAADEHLRSRLSEGARTSSVTTVTEHARRIRSVYENACQDFSHNPRGRANDVEFDYLHNALLDLGCDPSMIGRNEMEQSKRV
jgi:glycosyltransferase involved in cell wall biosynthesis